MRHYDFIFAGGGLAAMLTLLRLQDSGALEGKSVLVADPDSRTGNDRTWCFWEKGDGEWDAIAHRQWNFARFASNGTNRKMDLAPYRYKMIRGADFFCFAKNKLAGENITWLAQKVVGMTDEGNAAKITTENETFSSAIAFNSIFDQVSVLERKFPYLRQHFIGWTVRTENPVFDPDVPVFMDFSIAQKGNTRFMYVLPESANVALVEYTLFSADLLQDQEYESAISQYLGQMGSGSFEILERERGSIPMTAYPFHNKNSKHLIHIGSAGGWTKPSTGYTFANSAKRSRIMASQLQSGEDLSVFVPNPKFEFYDSLFIDVLFAENHLGHDIFTSLFSSGKPAKIFKFLDEETSLFEDLAVLLKCPKRPFIQALRRRIARGH